MKEAMEHSQRGLGLWELVAGIANTLILHTRINSTEAFARSWVAEFRGQQTIMADSARLVVPGSQGKLVEVVNWRPEAEVVDWVSVAGFDTVGTVPVAVGSAEYL